MEKTLLLYDALQSLSQGHLLRRVGTMSNGLYLENVPEISLVFTALENDGYLTEVTFSGLGTDSFHFYTLSPAGHELQHEVQRWYRRLPWYLKLGGRLGWPLPG